MDFNRSGGKESIWKITFLLSFNILYLLFEMPEQRATFASPRTFQLIFYDLRVECPFPRQPFLTFRMSVPSSRYAL